MNFLDKWFAAVEKKNSALCAGVDFSEFAMGRTAKGEGLAAGANKRDCALKYIEKVAPYCAAVKPNLRYWLASHGHDLGADNNDDLSTLEEIAALADSLDLVTIQDSKEADIGSTNDAGIFYAAIKGMDAITIAAFAGNMQEAANQGKDRGISVISMCLMSNPDYRKVKNMWVDVSETVKEYDASDIKMIDDLPHVRHYVALAHNAEKFGFDGIVIGAPSKDNHLQDYEIENAARYFKRGIKLVPGIGAQGGEVSMLAKYFDPKSLICNVGRGLMFPQKALTTPDDQAAAAKHYQEMLNGLRKTG